MTISDLEEVGYLKMESENLQDRIKDIEDKIQRINSPSFERMPRKNTRDNKKEELIVAYIDLKNQYEYLNIKLVKHIRKVEEAIERIPESIERQALRYRYIDGYLIEQISSILHYSERQIIRICNRAVEKLEIDSIN